jgi:PHP family Zn ribbon phosphoesterase
MRIVRADLHIHTGLSPCASEEMTPPAIVSEAVRKGLHMIAICDHNSAGNVQAVMAAAAAVAAEAAKAEIAATAEVSGVAEIAVVPGMEITTSEEVHVLGLFPDLSSARDAAEEVLGSLPIGESPDPPEGQFLFDMGGRVVGRERRLLFSASTFGLADAVALVRRHGGLAVASHVDRPSFSVLSQLGVFPGDVRFDALEISAAGRARGRHRDFLSAGLPLVSSSDSHYLDDIGSGYTVLEVAEPTFDELRLAFQNTGERRCCLA